MASDRSTPSLDGARIVALNVTPPAGTARSQRLALGSGEVAVAVQPRLSSRTAADGERRMNAFAGRALTAPLLEAEQNQRARRIALLNRALSAGVVEGLALAFDDDAIAAIDTAAAPPPAAGLELATARRITIEPGMALSAGGEEVIAPAAFSFDLLDLPVVAPRWLLSDADPAPAMPADADGSVLFARATGRSLRTLLTLGRPLPRVGIVVLEPIEHGVVQGADPFDQCERDLDAEAFEDQVRQDAARPVFYVWPDEWLPLPAPGNTWRNALAHAVFAREAELGNSQSMPWHGSGVPLALVAVNTAWQPLFSDRAAVARLGGRPRAEANAQLGAGTRFLWQARIDQFTEHLTEAAAAGDDTVALGDQMLTLPPAGLLPRDAVNARAARQVFFPSSIDVAALPVPIEQLDLVLEAAAGLSPIDLAVRDSICVYVPVPQTLFDPKLLLTEVADVDHKIADAIERHVDDRADWLRRRQRQRKQREALSIAAEGPDNTDTVPDPQDDPLRVEDERLLPLLPAPAGLLHRSANVRGLHQHFLDHATETLAVGKGDVLYAWVQLDREFPPRTLMLQWQIGGSWEHRAYWGENLIGWGLDGTPSRLQQSTDVPPAVPTPGRWHRLEIPAAALALEDTSVGGVAFTLYDGQALFGPVGVLRNGAEAVWLDQKTLDSGTLRGEGESWDFVTAADADTAFESAYDTSANANGERESTELTGLLAEPLIAGRKLAPITGDDSKLTPTEADAAKRGFQTLAALIQANGLRQTVADLSSRIDEADDAVNLGYLRVQTDMYRLRQTVLKQSQASRFAVSPALTQIADLDNASATREQLSDFYGTVKSETQLKRPDGATAPPIFPIRTRTGGVAPVPVPRGIARAGAGVAESAAALNVTSNVGIGRSVGGFMTPAPSPIRVIGAPISPISTFTPAAPSIVGSIGVIGGSIGGVIGSGNLGGIVGGQVALDPRINLAGLVPLAPVATAPPPSTKVTDSSALTGKAEIRTTSIASRLERPRAIEAKDFTVATRLEVISKLAALGLDLDELEVPGIAEKQTIGGVLKEFDPGGQPLRAAPIKLSALRLRFADLSFDPDPEDKARDESAYFLGGVDLSDHTIAVLRAAEGIVRKYRDALARCQKSLAAIDASLGGLASRLALVERELAESRQDVATARALLAEDQQRAAALNARRDAIIAEHVKFLAFARARIGSRTVALPSRLLDSALEPDAVPACLAEHDDPPGDVAAMIGIVRQAPVDWFPALRAHLSLLDTHFVADRVLTALPLTASAITATNVSALTLLNGLAGGASQQIAFNAVRAQAESVNLARSEALPFAAVALSSASLGLVGKIDLIARSASLADLAAANAERNLLNRRMTEEIARIAQVATCLHARLSTVRAGIRLDWAERFSQFDSVGDLGNLSTLPHFGELERDDREDIRDLASWLRRRVDANQPRAVALMAALVRVCLLAASHSPAGQLLTGRLVRPIPIHPGVRFEVQPSLPDRLRVGMKVQLMDPVLSASLGVNRIAAHAVVADIVGGIAHVSVTQTVQAGFTPSARSTVNFLLG
ncbi:hypothetical protein ASC95_18450 [Pelomonas sp. Root1217]|uniref:hypothetical protein n=1 Tax=Pelomonas sp. Root1217 TaxID=1736430 RepID=UPI00070BCEF5|nr:hypothetical protein [Pelomonas sp. Root1217]KQV47965.1 hypothetical protein ASC95_18450 [Pelomonas sp. Root1217]